ncbi:hypothetical protein BVH03_18495 [Pseudomonas sp. PA15(2017)]|nr:hypothetical protein BVH03_18495 [Pseudomonas sp. PA15(2017)]
MPAAALVAACMIQVGCGSAPEERFELPGAGPTEIEKSTYQCEGGTTVAVTYANRGDTSVTLLTPPDEKEVLLVRVIAASGAKYVGDRYEWWTKGDSASYTKYADEEISLQCVETK